MFTGIITQLGRVRGISGLGRVYKLSIDAGDIVGTAAIGDSVAVNGVCLTVTEKAGDKSLSFDVIGETMRRTNLSRLKYGDVVNLEGALKAGSPLNGHFVLGHVDCIGRIKDIRHGHDNVSIEITYPGGYEGLVVEKGSIALDGISLTVGEAGKDNVLVYVIPHTLKMTTLSSRRTGDEVNIEFDIIGKYIVKKFEKK